MLRILLRILLQVFSVLLVLLGVACTFCGAGDRVYVGSVAVTFLLYAAVSLRT